MRPLEAYASATSVFPGETIFFHVATEREEYYFRIDIYRKGKEDTLAHSGWGSVPGVTIPVDASESGCGWPPAYELIVPGHWPSGVYEARFTSVMRYAGPSTEVIFVLKSGVPGLQTKILMSLTVNTYQAYNEWGGKSLYTLDRAIKVSFDRPSIGQGSASFYAYEFDFVKWAETNGFLLDYCTNVDIHAANAPSLLSNYQLLISVGHDEYWSKEMRDNVEAFIANGGNVAFFSGNVCWWQVRFENNDRTMVCYKDAKADPLVDPDRRTTLWRAAPVNRPENSMAGVSYAHGGFWSQVGPRPPIDYTVCRSQHWVFGGTGLADGDSFGKEDLIIGYETDAALFVENNDGVPEVTGVDGTPLNFVILATADLPGWAREPDFAADSVVGRATMGLYQNGGTVFTAATTDWSHGLRGKWNAVSQITHNVLTRMSHPIL